MRKLLNPETWLQSIAFGIIVAIFSTGLGLSLEYFLQIVLK